MSHVSRSPVNFVQGYTASALGDYDNSVAGQNPSPNALVNLSNILMAKGDTGKATRAGGRAMWNDAGDQAMGKVVPSLAPNTLAGMAYNVPIDLAADPLNFLTPGLGSVVNKETVAAHLADLLKMGEEGKGGGARPGASKVTQAPVDARPKPVIPTPGSVTTANGAETLTEATAGAERAVVPVANGAEAVATGRMGSAIAVRPEIAKADLSKWGGISQDGLASRFPPGEIPLPDGPKALGPLPGPDGKVKNAFLLGHGADGSSLVAYGEENLPRVMNAGDDVIPTPKAVPANAAPPVADTPVDAPANVSPYAIEDEHGNVVPDPGSANTAPAEPLTPATQPRDTETGRFVPVQTERLAPVEATAPAPAPAPVPVERPVPPGSVPPVAPRKPTTPRPMNAGEAVPPKTFGLPKGFTQPELKPVDVPRTLSDTAVSTAPTAKLVRPETTPPRGLPLGSGIAERTIAERRAGGVRESPLSPVAPASQPLPTSPRPGLPAKVTPGLPTPKAGESVPAIKPITNLVPGPASVAPTVPRMKAPGYAMRPALAKAGQVAGKALGVAKKVGGTALDVHDFVNSNQKAAQYTLDLSATLRQGLMLGLSRPAHMVRAYAAQVKAVASEANAAEVLADIANRPNAKVYAKTGLYVPTAENAENLYHREEVFAKYMIDKVPGVGHVIKASDRGYSSYLASLRADTFDGIAAGWAKKGITPETHPGEYDALATWINTASGRGNLGAWEKSAPIIGKVVNSPRLQASRVALLNPADYIRMPPATRRIALKDAFVLFGTNLALSHLASAYGKLNPKSGVSSSRDWRSTDFMKTRIGNSTVELNEGLGGWGRFFGQMLTATTVDPSGKVHVAIPAEWQTTGKEKYRGGTLGRFAEGRLNPLEQTVWQIMRGTDYRGNPTTADRAAIASFTPLIIQDWKAAVKEHGLLGGTALTGISFHGGSVSTKEDVDPSDIVREPLPSEKLLPKPVPSPGDKYNDADF